MLRAPLFVSVYETNTLLITKHFQERSRRMEGIAEVVTSFRRVRRVKPAATSFSATHTVVEKEKPRGHGNAALRKMAVAQRGWLTPALESPPL